MLSVVETSTRRFPCLDGVRALAVASVCWGHANRVGCVPEALKPLARYLPTEAFGVRVFFVISGFLITRILSAELNATGRIELKSFYSRRAWRLLPALAVFLIFVAAVDLFTAVDETAVGWLTTLTFSKNLAPSTWLTNHLWSLAVEVQFYLFWPLLLAAIPAAWRAAAALCLIALAVALRYALLRIGHAGFANVALFTNLDLLMTGALLAIVPPFRRSVWSSIGALSVALVLGSAGFKAAEAEFGLPWRALKDTVQAVAIGIVLADLMSRQTGFTVRVLEAGPIAYLGKISYSWYLWQQAFFAPHGYYGFDIPWVLHFPFNIVVSMVAGILSFEFVEVLSARARSSHVSAGSGRDACAHT